MGKSKDIQFVVITPERQVLEETADSVVFAAHDGELGVLHSRAPLMCELGMGQLRYQAGGLTRRYFIDGGFAQVHENTVTVLTQQAVPVEEITPEMIASAEESADALDAADPMTADARRKAQQRVRMLRQLRIAT